MKLLLDTHTLLWSLQDVERLSPRAAELIDAAETCWFSIASLWEIAIKLNLNKLKVDGAFPHAILQIMTREQIQILQIQPDDLERLASLALHHRDPFDRMLAAQALAGELTLVSRDRTFDAYGVNRVW